MARSTVSEHPYADGHGTPGPAQDRVRRALGRRTTGRTTHPRNWGASRAPATGYSADRAAAGTIAAATTTWDLVHIAVDDCTRLPYVEVLADERASTAAEFLRRALEFYRRHGITVERLITDNGNAYRSTVHAIACRALDIRHLRHRVAQLLRGRREGFHFASPGAAAGTTGGGVSRRLNRTVFRTGA